MGADRNRRSDHVGRHDFRHYDGGHGGPGRNDNHDERHDHGNDVDGDDAQCEPLHAAAQRCPKRHAGAGHRQCVCAADALETDARLSGTGQPGARRNPAGTNDRADALHAGACTAAEAAVAEPQRPRGVLFCRKAGDVARRKSTRSEP